MFEFRITLTENDYVEFNRYDISRNRTLSTLLTICRVAVPVMLAARMGLSLAKQAGTTDLVIEGAVYTVIAALWVALFPKFNGLFIRFYIGRLKKSGRLPFDTEAVIGFDDEALYERGEHSDMNVKYTQIERIVDRGDYVYLYNSAVSGFIIPRAAFASEEEKESFLGFIGGKTGKEIITEKTA